MKKSIISLVSMAFICAMTLMSCDQIASIIDNPVGSYLQFEKSELSLLPGQMELNVATTISTEKVKYESSDESVATVDQSGMVTAVAVGEATITASVKANEYYKAGSATCLVKVGKPVTAVTITAPATPFEMTVGDADVTLTATVLPTDATDKSLTWTSSDPAVATVDQTGKVHAVAAGTTTIKATASNGIQGEIALTVTDMLSTPLTLEALTAGTIVVESPQTGMQYSLDGGTTKTDVTSSPTTIDVAIGDKVQFYGTAASYNGTQITGGTAQVKVYGNIMSLIDATNFATATTLTENLALAALFFNNTNLKDASGLQLPATTLTLYCYNSMFKGCSGLTAAPELPATTLAQSCYADMFAGCSGLTAAPELPATTLAQSCYTTMFFGCTGLTAAPALPATTLAINCYSTMFYNCSGLTAAPELPATTLANSCYANMFYNCSGLTAAPALPATTLAQGCYFRMFYGCSGLTAAPELPATTLAVGCYQSMFAGCSGLTTAPALPATTLTAGCYNQMFGGCSGLTTAPVLPATTLVQECYKQMFQGCSNLNSVTCLATDLGGPYSDTTTNWLAGVAATGTFTKAASMTSWWTGASAIPSGWQVANQ